MTQFLILTLLSCVAMALSQAVLGAFFPSTHRPWWHPLKREVRPGAAEAPQTALQLVETLDRRQTSLPFVGRDRRKVAQAEAQSNQRRTGTRD
jgi:hypothetical protein